jgi:hypothetical protein
MTCDLTKTALLKRQKYLNRQNKLKVNAWLSMKTSLSAVLYIAVISLSGKLNRSRVRKRRIEGRELHIACRLVSTKMG